MVFIREKQYKANLHSHSVLSDGHLTPEELKELYKSRGYSILAVTDHERPADHTYLSDEDFLMITGYEAYIRPSEDCVYDVYAPEIHLNLFARSPHNIDLINWNDRYVKYVKDPAEKAAMPRYGDDATRKYTKEYINSFIRTAKEDGYLVALNHPVWSMEELDFLFGIRGWFSMEMCNYGSFHGGQPEYNGAFYDMLLRRGERVFVHGADDNHNGAPADSPACDSFGAFAMIGTDDDRLSYDGVIRSLEKGDFYASTGPVIRSLSIENGRAHICTSDAARIAMLFGAKTTKHAFPDTFDGTINEAVFEIPEKASYVRFSVTDRFGHTADTRGYFRDEFTD